ncbi:MAG: aminotransferase class I/II-fold pyridoxal phosphate-dependent enzyme [Nanoarchaeota archaeon]
MDLETIETNYALRPFEGGIDGSLTEHIACWHGVDPAQIVLGRGSLEVLRALMPAIAYRAGKSPSDVAIGMEVTEFDGYDAFVPNRVRWSGNRFEPLPGGVDAVVVSNPANPSGVHDVFVGALVHGAAGSGQLVIVDEAYIEFSGQASLVPRVQQDSNLIVLRTFSKLYGLVDEKVGYAVVPASLANQADVLPPSPQAQERAHHLHLSQDGFAAVRDVRDRRSILEEMLRTYLPVEMERSHAPFVLARPRGRLDLGGFLSDIAVRVKNVSKPDGWPRPWSFGECRIAVPSYAGLEELGRRLYDANR